MSNPTLNIRLMRLAVKAAVLVQVAGLAACAATPESRIKDDPMGFAKLPPDIQEMIKHGQVGIGFDEAEVKLAIGDPDRITERTDVSGVSQVWRYVEYENDDGTFLYTGFYHHYYAPAFAPFYLDYPARQERDTMRVIFTGGHVSAVERELQ